VTERTSYAVIGLGLFGSAIARTLAAMGHDVLAIDRRLALVEAIGSSVSEAVQTDATDKASLAALHVGRYGVVFVTLGDLTASILCTLALRELGVKRIIAKINSPQQGRILSRLGASDLLFPERDMGERVARQVASASSIISEIDLSRETSLVEIPAPHVLHGKTLEQAGIRRRWGVTVVAVKRRSANGIPEEVVVSPPPTLVIRDGDLVVLAGRNEDLERLRAAE
jgi:trk system potassium uptake protein TrkA